MVQVQEHLELRDLFAFVRAPITKPWHTISVYSKKIHTFSLTENQDTNFSRNF